jgi:hypothetical protein
VCDAANSRVHVLDATAVPPRQITSIKLREQPSWISFNLDGRFADPSTGRCGGSQNQASRCRPQSGSRPGSSQREAVEKWSSEEACRFRPATSSAWADLDLWRRQPRGRTDSLLPDGPMQLRSRSGHLPHRLPMRPHGAVARPEVGDAVFFLVVQPHDADLADAGALRAVYDPFAVE